jgi:hypothetical protein
MLVLALLYNAAVEYCYKTMRMRCVQLPMLRKERDLCVDNMERVRNVGLEECCYYQPSLVFAAGRSRLAWLQMLAPMPRNDADEKWSEVRAIPKQARPGY